MIKVKLHMLPMPSVKRPNLSRTSFWIEESLNVLYVKDMGEEGFSLKRQTTWCKIYWRKAWRKYALCVNPLLVKMQIHGKRTIDITSYSWSYYGYQITQQFSGSDQKYCCSSTSGKMTITIETLRGVSCTRDVVMALHFNQNLKCRKTSSTWQLENSIQFENDYCRI